MSLFSSVSPVSELSTSFRVSAAGVTVMPRVSLSVMLIVVPATVTSDEVPATLIFSVSSSTASSMGSSLKVLLALLCAVGMMMSKLDTGL